MTTISRLSCIASLLLTTVAAYAQQPAIEQVGTAAQANLNALAAGNAAVLPMMNSEGMKGSPYADNRWLLARITLSNKVLLTPVPLKYDVLNSRLLMRPVNRPTDSLQINDQQISRFELEEPATGGGAGRRRLFRRFEEAPVENQRSNYVEVLHEGKYTLLKRYGKQLHKATSPGAYTDGKRYDEVEDRNVYYLRRPDATLTQVKLNLRTMQAAAPELALALKKSAEAQAAKTDADWVAVFSALDPK